MSRLFRPKPPWARQSSGGKELASSSTLVGTVAEEGQLKQNDINTNTDYR